MSANNEVSRYSRENVALMREQLLQSIKRDAKYAPAYHLLAFVDFVSDERPDEALEMAEKAQQLAPSNKNYAELVDDIKQFRAGQTAPRDRREPIKSNAIAAPERASTSRMLGGEGGPVAINDGQTVDNSGALPAVDEVVNKVVEALGGAAALKAVTSRVMKGSLDIIGVSRGGTFETYKVAPDKALTIMQPASGEIVKVGYNGQIAWLQTDGVVRQLKGAELASVQKDADFYSMLHLKDRNPKLTLAGKSKIGYREVYVIELQPGSGAARLFVDTQTYLPVRLNTVQVLQGGALPVEIYYDDWQEANGVKVPYVVTQSFPKRTVTMTVKEVKTNIPVDAKIFEKPL
jgi:outer membrane lipoprotein-sorting protein